MRPYSNRWWRRPLRRTLARATVHAADGHTYLVRAVRAPEARESVVLDVATGVAGAVLPGVGGHLVDAVGYLPFMRMRWSVEVLRRSSPLRRRRLVHVEVFVSADQSVKRALLLAHRLETARGLSEALASVPRLPTPPKRRR